MSDNLSETLLNRIIGEPAEASAAFEPETVSADVTADTAGAEPTESVTLEEALSAALDGERTPQDTPQGEQQAETEEEAPLSPEETIAALQAEVEKFRAAEAERELAPADIDFEQQLQTKIDRAEDVYDDLEDVLWRIARSQGLSDDEIELKVNRYLYEGRMGPIKHLDQYGRETGQVLQPKNQWLRTLPAARDAERARYFATKSTPSAIDQLTQTYNLSVEDRQKLTTLAAKLTPEELSDVAALFASKNQNVNNIFQQATIEARQNTADRLNSSPAPGSPGAPPPKKPYEFTHDPRVRHDETALVAARLGLIGR